MSKLSREDLIQKLMGTFLDEMDEHVLTLTDGLLLLEKTTPQTKEYQQQMRALFRAAHSLKGAARSVDAQSVEYVCHEMEEFLGLLKTNEVKPAPDVFQLLFSAAEALKQMSSKLRKRQKIDVQSIDDLLQKLKHATASLTPPSHGCCQTPGLADSEANGHHAADEKRKAMQETKIAIDVKNETGKMEEERKNSEKEAVEAEEIEQAIEEKSEATAEDIALKTIGLVGESRQVFDGRFGDEPLSIDVNESSGSQPDTTTRGSLEAQSLRVSSERLDHLLALSSEMLTSFRRTESWQATMEEFSERLRNRLADWQPIERSLRIFLEEGLDRTRQSFSSEKITDRDLKSGRMSTNMEQRLLSAPAANTTSLKDLVRDVDRIVAAMKTETRSIGESARLVDEEIRRLRMRPFCDACLGLQLAVRELCLSTGKVVDLQIDGGETELDRSMLEQLRDPLLHLVRNSVQHGIESPEERKALGKPAQSVLHVSASLRGQHVQIEVRDDGRGINEQGVKLRARKNGLAEPTTKEEIVALVFSPGFSTSSSVDLVAGRGVGLDVVASQVEALQGSVSLSYERGEGTCFTLTVPLTLTKIRVLLVKAAGQFFALPSSNVQKLLRIHRADLSTIQGKLVLPFEGSFIAVCSLGEALRIADSSCLAGDKRLPAVVLGQADIRRAFLVDELVCEQEVVVSGLGERLQCLRSVSGATLLGGGEIALILNTAELMRRHQNSRSLQLGVEEKKIAQRQKRLIICDDSPTTRILEASILEAAGYEVTAVADGQDAWDVLQTQGADLIVSDVEMPVMDGFSLARTIRASEKWRDIPIILITGLAKDSDRENGLKSGANAYVVKSEFDQVELISAIEQLI